MKKLIFAAVAAALIACGLCCAAAESASFRAGARAAILEEDVYFIVREDTGDALVRFDGGVTPYIAERADTVASLVEYEGALYYLRASGGAWELVRRTRAGNITAVHRFEGAREVSRLSVYGANLFVLVDGNLHIIYPGQDLCVKLAGAMMSEYVIVDDWAYFVSLTDTAEYSAAYPGGSAARTAGALYRLNLSTGDTSAVIKTGVENLSYAEGRLYFNNLADAYAVSGEAYFDVRGKLYACDLDGKALECLWDDYDWGYFLVGDALLLRNAQGLWYGGENVAEVAQTAEVAAVGDTAVIFDQSEVRVNLIKIME